MNERKKKQDKSLEGLVDFAALKTEEPPHSVALDAIAQMIMLDPRVARVDGEGNLIVVASRLSDRAVWAGSPLYVPCPPPNRRRPGGADEYDLDEFLPQWTIRASTAILIEDQAILTAGHAVIPRDGDEIEPTYFIFGRAIDSALAEPNDPDRDRHLVIPSSQWVKATRVRRMEDGGGKRGPFLPDWAVVELERSPENATPVALASEDEPEPSDGYYTLSHPLGLPIKYAQVEPRPASEKSTADVRRFSVDFASGASGSPLLAPDENGNTKVFGVINGNARFNKGMLRRPDHTGRRHIHPRGRGHGNPATSDQPVTMASHIRKQLGQI